MYESPSPSGYVESPWSAKNNSKKLTDMDTLATLDARAAALSHVEKNEI